MEIPPDALLLMLNKWRDEKTDLAVFLVARTVFGFFFWATASDVSPAKVRFTGADDAKLDVALTFRAEYVEPRDGLPLLTGFGLDFAIQSCISIHFADDVDCYIFERKSFDG